MHLVHVITRWGDRRAWETAAAHARGRRVTVLLLQDGVLESGPAPAGVEVVASARDMEAYGLAGRHRAVDDAGIVDLLFAADRVISW